MSSFSNKTDLEKKNVKTLRSYSRYFNIKQPYKVIVGPYFCQIVAEKRISLQDGIRSVFLQRDCELYTTRCCINDLQKLIDKKQTKFIRGAHILRTLQLLPCLHKNNKKPSHKPSQQRWNCIDSIHCIQLYINKGKYCFSLQPRSFLGRIRSKPGIPSIWMYQSSMILDKLSKSSQIFIQNNKNLSQDDIQKKLEINRFIDDDNDDEDDIDVKYDITKELQLDDEQNIDELEMNDTEKVIGRAIVKDNKRNLRHRKDRNNKNKKKGTEIAFMRNRNYRKRFHGQNRIRYGPDGGFDTMGLKVPSRKKRRTKRGKKNTSNNDQIERENLNDNTFETVNDVMSISKSQKEMSTWWKH